MVPAVWRLCLWTIEELADSFSDSFTRETSLRSSNVARNLITSNAGDNSVIYLINNDGLSRTVLQLCECMPSMREIVVSNLLGKCYVGDDATSSSATRHTNNSNNLEENYCNTEQIFDETPLGFAATKYGIISDYNRKYHEHSEILYDDNDQTHWESGRGRERGRGEGNDEKVAVKIRLLQSLKRARFRKKNYLIAQSQSLLAATVLQHLVRAYPEIGASVLTSIMDRLTPSSSSLGGLVSLTPPAILHW